MIQNNYNMEIDKESGSREERIKQNSRRKQEIRDRAEVLWGFLGPVSSLSHQLLMLAEVT